MSVQVHHISGNKKFEHYYFSITAILFIIGSIIGFSASARMKMDNGIQMSSFRFIAHGISGFLWMIFYLLQTQLIFRKKYSLHQRLGKLGFPLLSLIVLSTLYLLLSAKSFYPQIPAEVVAIESGLHFFNLFYAVVMISLGVWKRKNPFLHKRFMFFGTLFFALTGIDRIPIFFGVESNPAFMFGSILFITLPLLIFDLFKSYGRLKFTSVLFFLSPFVVFGLSLGILMPYVYSSELWSDIISFLSV